MEQSLRAQIAKVETEHWWYEARRRILSSIIARFGLPPEARVLEAGCGTGANLGMLQAFGKVSAFEPDDYAREEARKRHENIQIAPGTLPDGIPCPGPFDLICAFDVIEHVEDDVAALKNLRALLKDGGHAVFTVPAYQFLWSRHDDLNHHKRRYTRSGFAKTLRQAGFKVEFVSHFNTILFPLAAAALLLRKALGDTAEDAEVTMPKSPFINGLLMRIFAFERHALKYLPLPLGLSVLAVCRK